MAHIRILFIGGRNNLQKIFDNCADSSSESKAELAFGADWIGDIDWDTDSGDTTDNFTKSNYQLYSQIMDGCWGYCFDIRNTEHYGDFACLNCPDYEEEVNRDAEKRNRQRTKEMIEQLPPDTIFHFADSHW